MCCHGSVDRQAAEHCLSVPSVAVAQERVKTRGESKKWRDFAPEAGGTTAGSSSSSSVEPPETPNHSHPSSEVEDAPACCLHCRTARRAVCDRNHKARHLFSLWLQRAQAPGKGAIAQFLKQLLRCNKTAKARFEATPLHHQAMLTGVCPFLGSRVAFLPSRPLKRGFRTFFRSSFPTFG